MIRSTFRTIPLVVLLHGCSATPGPDGSEQDMVYVTNEAAGSLSVIDAAKARVVATIPLGKRPRGIVASPDRQRLYIALSGSPAAGPGVEAASLPPADKSADGIAVFDVATQRVVKVLRGVSDPEQLALSPDGALLYVASEDSGLLVAIDTRSGVIVRSLKVGSEPEGVAVAPTGNVVAVTSEGENRVSIVDAGTMALRSSIAVGKRPRGLAFSVDGKTLFVTNEQSHSIGIIDVASGSVSRVIEMEDSLKPMAVLAAADGRALYVSTGRGGKVVRLDPRTFRQDAAVPVGTRPWGIGLGSDGRRLYAANGPSNDVAVIDTQTFAVTSRINVGASPWGLVVVGRR